MSGGGHDESFERWGNLSGPEAVTARLQAIETRLEQFRRDVVEVGHWADHPARQLRQAHESRRHH